MRMRPCQRRRGSTLLVTLAVLLLMGLIGFAYDSQARATTRAVRRAYLGQVALLGAKAAVDQVVADWLARTRPPVDGGQLDDRLQTDVRDLKPGQVARASHEIERPTSPPDAMVDVKSAVSQVQWLTDESSSQNALAPTLTREQVTRIRDVWRMMYLKGT